MSKLSLHFVGVITLKNKQWGEIWSLLSIWKHGKSVERWHLWWVQLLSKSNKNVKLVTKSMRFVSMRVWTYKPSPHINSKIHLNCEQILEFGDQSFPKPRTWIQLTLREDEKCLGEKSETFFWKLKVTFWKLFSRWTVLPFPQKIFPFLFFSSRLLKLFLPFNSACGGF